MPLVRHLMLACSVLVALPAAEIPKLAPLPLEPCLGMAVIPKPLETLRRWEALRTAFGTTEVRTLKDMGLLLGDPDLAGLDLAQPLLVIATPPEFTGMPPGLAIVLSVRNPAPYQAWAKVSGLTALAKDGLLILQRWPLPAGVADRLPAAYAQIVSALPKADLRLSINLAELDNAYAMWIRQGVANAMARCQQKQAQAVQDGQPFPGNLDTLLALGALGFCNLLDHAQGVQTDVVLGDVGLGDMDVRIDHLFEAETGTPLAEALTAPAKDVRSGAELLTEGTALLGLAARWDGKGMVRAVREYAARVANEALLTGKLRPALVQSLARDETYAGLAAGGAAAVLRVGEAGDLEHERILAVLDPAQVRQAMDQGLALFAEGGLMADCFKGLGLRLSLAVADKVRSVQEIPVSSVTPKAEAIPGHPLETAAQFQVQAMATFRQTQEFAFTDRWLLASNRGANLDALIGRALAAPAARQYTPAAAKRFGTDHHILAEADAVGIGRALLSSILKTNPFLAMGFGKVMAALPTQGTPITLAADLDQGRSRCQCHVPLQPFIDLARVLAGKRDRLAPPVGGGEAP